MNNRSVAGGADMFRFYRGYTAGTNSTLSGRISVAANTTSYVTSSDYRLKMDIEAMTGGIDRVNRMKPCTFKWNNTGEYGEGFIAHELAEVVPVAVVGTKDEMENGEPKYQGIDTRYLVATLTTAIQELDRIVKTQQTEIQNLKNRLDSN
jgi:Chaperone of endosialidase